MEKKILTENFASCAAIEQSTENIHSNYEAHLKTQEETVNILGNTGNLVTSNDHKEAEETKETENSELNTLSHTELKRFFQGALSQLLQDDSILTDLHPQVTLEEVCLLFSI